MVRPRSAKKWALILLLAVCVALVAVSFIPSPARRALPSTAQRIREYRHVSGSSDYVYLLKAELPERDFAAYAAKVDLTNRCTQGAYEEHPIGFGETTAPDWWTPPERIERAYYQHKVGSTSFEIVGWQDGWVYYKASKW